MARGCDLPPLRGCRNAFGALADAFEVVKLNDARFYEAELFRLKRELLLKRPAPNEEAEANFRQAILLALLREQATEARRRAELPTCIHSGPRRRRAAEGRKPYLRRSRSRRRSNYRV